MQNLDCSSLENSSAEFEQLNTVIEEVRNYLNAFRGNQDQIRVYSFEIPQQLFTPLENLNTLLLALAKEIKLSDAQKKLLTTCERALARFYCWIHHCLTLYIERCKVEPAIDESQRARQMAYEFYFYAMYELRTYYYVLKGYLQTPLLESESGNRKDFLSQVRDLIPVSENRARVERINFWIEELGKAIDDLPRLRNAAAGDGPHSNSWILNEP